MSVFLKSLHYAVRQLRKTPGFTVVCTLTLALGIGANTAVFSVMNALLLRSLPVADPDRVVYLNTSEAPRHTGTVDSHETFSYPVYDALRQQHGALTQVMAYVPLSTGRVAVRYGTQPEEAQGDMVSGNFFSALGVKLIRGHGFTEEDESTHAPIAVLSYNYWNRRFLRDPGLVLLIAFSNVVMLLLARNATRRREFSLRLALGAGRSKLFRQLLSESLLLVALGGALAWFFAVSATRLLAAWAQIESSLAPDRTVLFFTLSILVLAAMLFGLAPLRSALSAEPALALKTSAATSNADASKTRAARMIVALQMALCVVLLVGGGLLIRTLRNLQHIPLGFSTRGLVVFGLNPQPTGSVPEGVAFYRDLMGRMHALPGVESVTIMAERIGSFWSDNNYMIVDGRKSDVLIRSNVVGPDFFHTLGVPVLKGRDFADSDTSTSPHVGIINELFAKRFFPNQNPLGHTIGTGDGEYQMTIVGVVKDHKYRSIDEEPIPMSWFMYAQLPIVFPMHVELRVQGEPLAILPAAGRVVQQMNPNLPLTQPMTQQAQYESTISQQLLFARLAGFFGLLAVLLVATGLYGTLAYRVNNRTVEIGVRMAVGAGRGQVVWMVLRDSLVLTAIGTLVGIPLAALVARGLTSVLYGVKQSDGLSYLLAVTGVAIVALIASILPARRAATVDPIQALRSE